MNKLLKDLLLAHGVSGEEEEVSKIIAAGLNKSCDEVGTDKLGNVIGRLGKGKRKLMIIAHMDEVGLAVKHIDKDGFVYFTVVGGVIDNVLVGQLVQAITNSEEHITGLIGTKPPHLMTPKERTQNIAYKDMFIDFGFKDRATAEEHLTIGDAIGFMPNAGDLDTHGHLGYGKGVDNRLGVYAMLETVKNLKSEIGKLDLTVYAVASSQEEVGLKGASVVASALKPDFTIVLDTTIAGDMPGVDEKTSSLKLGNGVVFTFLEASGRGAITPKHLRNFLIDTAKKNKIKYQLDLFEGGMTDASFIQLRDDGNLVCSITAPTRYIHSPSAVFDYRDVEALIKFTTATTKAFADNPNVIEK